MIRVLKVSPKNQYSKFFYKNLTFNQIWLILWMMDSDALPSSLIDSNVSMKWKQRKSKESRHAP
jgi:hypothetical protein